MDGRWRLLLWVAVLSGFQLAACERDLYAILEVERTATTKQVKKAYRRLSLQWHPDKNVDNEEAEAKFIDISQAYSVLSDAEKRDKYDKYGEKGLESSGAVATFKHQNPFEVFNRFFGKENLTANPYVNLFNEDNSEVDEITPESWKDHVDKGTRRNVVVAYYWPNCTACEDLQHGYAEVAEKFQGIVAVGAVNCKRYELLCVSAKRERCEKITGKGTYKKKKACLEEEASSGQLYESKEHVLLVYYGPDTSQSMRPQQGEYSFQSLSKWIAGAMGSFARSIRSAGDLSAWLKEEQGTMKFVFLATKSEAPPQVKGLSIQFHGRASFGAVLSGADAEVQERFHGQARPGLLRVVDRRTLSVERCELELKPASMAAFVTRALGKATRDGDGAVLHEWDEARLRAGDCAAHDESFCLLLFLEVPVHDAQLLETFRSMAGRLREEPVKVFTVPMRLAAPFHSAHGDIVIFSPRAKRFRRFSGDPTSIAELASFVDYSTITSKNASLIDLTILEEELSEPLPHRESDEL